MKKTIFIIVVFALLVFKNHAQTVTDIDGNVYNTVTIGTQVWMKENLKVTKYCNSNVIGTTTTPALDISSESTPKYQWAYSGDENNVATYGRLYTWYAISDSLCPVSWHVPSVAEWTTLTDYLGGETIAGGKLKETGIVHWSSPNTGATNETGFTALPGGQRYDYGAFLSIGVNGGWWSSTNNGTSSAFGKSMSYSYTDVVGFNSVKRSAYSVRCVRDAAAQINEIYNKIEIVFYPNPFSNSTTIEISDSRFTKGDLAIYDMLGRAVHQQLLSSKRETLNLNLPAGVYFYKISNEKKEIVGNGKLMIQ